MNRKGLETLIVMPFTVAGFIVQLVAKIVALRYFGLVAWREKKKLGTRGADVML